MAIPEDRQQAALREAQETITQTRAAVQAAAQTLTDMLAQYGPYVTASKDGPFEDEWNAIAAEFGPVKAVVDAAVAAQAVAALANLQTGA